jgi:hypothetical protein
MHAGGGRLLQHLPMEVASRSSRAPASKQIETAWLLRMNTQPSFGMKDKSLIAIFRLRETGLLVDKSSVDFRITVHH